MGQLFATSDAFRSARDSWWSGRLNAKATKFSDPTKIAAKARRKEERWTISGRRYLSAYKGLDGKLIRYPADLLRLTEDLIEDVAPKMAAAFDTELGKLAFDAWRGWPVSTGLSRSLIDVEYERTDDTHFEGRVISRAPYTVFINRGKTYRELLQGPGREAASRILKDLEQSRVGDHRGR